MSFRLPLLAAAFGLALSNEKAEASTFTPDMWVYEVTFNPVELLVDSMFREARAEATSVFELPSGCFVDPVSFERVEVVCRNTTATADTSLESLFNQPQPLVQTIGFNSFQIVCAGFAPIVGCPPGTGGFGSAFFSDVSLDAIEGLLSYCGFTSFGDFGACYSLAPQGVVASGFSNIGTARGFWDFGLGGFWEAGPDSKVRYEGTGRLLSSPSVIPLPAPALMLGSALLAFGAFGLRANGVRRKTQS